MNIDIRQCIKGDLPYIYEICYQTAQDEGSTEEICKDRFKIGHFYAAPYLHFDLETCFVVTVDNIPKGYIIGTHDTAEYTEWLNAQWLPEIRGYYDFTETETIHAFEKDLNREIQIDAFIDDRLADYPAHLHIDLMPELQGKGLGRKLMSLFFDRCREKGAHKVHLGVSKENPGAVTFYQKIGMYVIFEDESCYFMGYDL